MKVLLILVGVILAVEAAPRMRKARHVGEQDLGQGQQETGNPVECNGLDCDEYKEVKKTVKKIKETSAANHGQTIDGDNDDDDDGNDGASIGDILLTADQATEVLNSLDKSGSSKRKMNSYSWSKWSSPIYYQIDTGVFPIGSYEYNAIKSSLAVWQDNTCLEFIDGTPASSSQAYLYFESPPRSGCSSFVGQVKPKQAVKIGANCANNPAVVIHEIGHALGLFHEQSRPDRDDYVSINEANIKPAALGNFDLSSSSDTLGVAYDYGSVMHYGETYFSTNGQKTIIAKDTDKQIMMGTRALPTFFDFAAVNFHYGCNAGCNTACEMGGYPAPGCTGKCMCPEGYGGHLCRYAAEGSSGCTPSSGVLTPTNVKQCVSSPNFGNGKYSVGDSCSWVLRAGSGQRIDYNFVSFSIWYDESFVEIKDAHNMTLRGNRYSGYSAPTNVQTSVSNEVAVIFDALGSYKNMDTTDTGFQFCFQLSGSGAVQTDACTSQPCQNGGACSVTSSGYSCQCPSNYNGNDCEIPDACLLAPCANGGTCYSYGSTNSHYYCTCTSDYEGDNCDTAVQTSASNNCDSNPCQNGGFCSSSTVSSGGVILSSYYWCSCQDGYSGTDCEIAPAASLNPCESNPCQFGSCGYSYTTVNGVLHSSSYTCYCWYGYSGTNCENYAKRSVNEKRDPPVDFCSSNPCGDDGTCVHAINIIDGIEHDSYHCQCQNGYVGQSCEMQKKRTLDGRQVPDGPCLSNPCQNGANCMEKIDINANEASYECDCKVGYSGVNCETDLDLTKRLLSEIEDLLDE